MGHWRDIDKIVLSVLKYGNLNKKLLSLFLFLLIRVKYYNGFRSDLSYKKKKKGLSTIINTVVNSVNKILKTTR